MCLFRHLLDYFVSSWGDVHNMYHKIIVGVTLQSLEVRVRKAFPSIPARNKIIHCLFQKACAGAILGGQGDILVAEV